MNFKTYTGMVCKSNLFLDRISDTWVIVRNDVTNIRYRIHPDQQSWLNLPYHATNQTELTFKLVRYCGTHKCTINETSPCTLDCGFGEYTYAYIIPAVEMSDIKVSDDFQIGPDGAFEYEEKEETWDEIFEQYVEYSITNSVQFITWIKQNYKVPAKI